VIVPQELELLPYKTKALPLREPWETFVQQRLETLRMSSTALHQYQTCPRKFFYSNLVMIPTPANPSGVYGEAVHFALRKFFDYAKRHRKWPEMETLQNDFNGAVKKHALPSAEDYRNLEKIAREELPALYAWYVDQGIPDVVDTEMAIRDVSLPLSEDHSVKLTGKFDRVDAGPNGSWVVIDYKTGKPKTENEFYGRTKNSDEQYWDQFRFYKLLAQLSPQGPKITRGRIVYVRDPSKSHEFEISEQDSANIKQKIGEVVSRIRAKDFDPVSTTQNAEPCKQCAYILLCRAGV
jgi:DNA helicase II / ATP-dependent DNA helicase PcrA